MFLGAQGQVVKSRALYLCSPPWKLARGLMTLSGGVLPGRQRPLRGAICVVGRGSKDGDPLFHQLFLP